MCPDRNIPGRSEGQISRVVTRGMCRAATHVMPVDGECEPRQISSIPDDTTRPQAARAIYVGRRIHSTVIQGACMRRHQLMKEGISVLSAAVVSWPVL